MAIARWWQEIASLAATWRACGEKIVFTNGCFDILHVGHVTYLEKARNLGKHLIVGLNTDASVRRLKGETRPLVHELDRARVLAALSGVDAVVLFDQDTPTELIEKFVPTFSSRAVITSLRRLPDVNMPVKCAL